MVGLLLTAAIFAFVSVIGVAFIAVVAPKANPLKLLLLAPCFGFGVVLLPTTLLSEMWIPVERFGGILCATLFLLSVAIIWRVRPNLPWKSAAIYLAPVLLALVLTGRPFLDFGLHWLSYSNDDMANYVISGERFAHYGFFSYPTPEQIVLDTDARQLYWFQHGVNLERAGSDLTIALALSVIRTDGFFVFMPVILALDLAFILATASLLVASSRGRWPSLFLAFGLTVFPLLTLGALLQLIAQVFGLTGLSASVSFMCSPDLDLNRGNRWRAGIAAAVLLSLTALSYPEVTPFLTLVLIGYYGLGLLRKQISARGLAAFLAISAGITALLLNAYGNHVFAVLHARLMTPLPPFDPLHASFPYFFLPSGLADLWGFAPIGTALLEPWQSIGIAAGGIVLIVTLLSAATFSLRREPAALIVLTMALFSISLLAGRKDFALFKLAMYAAPYLLAVLVLWATSFRRSLAPTALVIVVVLCGLPAQRYYVERSRDLPGSNEASFTTLSHASSYDLIGQIQAAHAASGGLGTIITDTAKDVFAKYENSHFVGDEFVLLSQVYENMVGVNNTNEYPLLSTKSYRDRISWAYAIMYYLSHYERGEYFDFHRVDPLGDKITDLITLDSRLGPDVLTGDPSAASAAGAATAPQGRVGLLYTGRRETIMNRLYTNDQHDVGVKPLDDVSNWLVFLDSDLGHAANAGSLNVAIGQLESDYYFPRSKFAGLGRYALFQVLKPTHGFRLMLDVTDTLNHDGSNLIPPFSVVGTSRYPIDVVGRGSAHLFSPRIEPQLVVGRPFIGLDAGKEGFTFAVARTGLMNLYGRDIELDPRKLVAFARNISLVSDEEYRSMRRPAALSRFPADLADPGLEYSGLYEDGWVADRAYAVLAAPHAGELRVVGSVPLLGTGFEPVIRLTVDGTAVAQRKLGAGEFIIRVPNVAAGTHRIGLEFSTMRHLRGADTRPVAAQLNFVGFVDRASAAPGNPGAAAGEQLADAPVYFESGWDPVETYAGETFRWFSTRAMLGADAPAHRVDIAYETGPGVDPSHFSLSVRDAQGATIGQTTAAGRHVLTVTGREALRFPLTLDVGGGGRHVASDPRVLDVRVFHVGAK